jgi:hypothetical protein
MQFKTSPTIVVFALDQLFFRVAANSDFAANCNFHGLLAPTGNIPVSPHVVNCRKLNGVYY